MHFAPSTRAQDYLQRLGAFMQEHVLPREAKYCSEVQNVADWRTWKQPSIMEELKAKARSAGLWNLFLPEKEYGAGLTNVEYAPLAEMMGRCSIAPEVFNCNPPDTGNMEVLVKYGSEEQKRLWLKPLLAGEIRSAFCMTEPGVASSDATNMQATAVIEGEHVVLNGRKWWSSGVGHPHCRLLIFMGLTDCAAPKYRRHSMVLVPLPTPGVEIVRMLPVFGAYDAPFGHGEVSFRNVRLPADNIIAGPGRGFEIAQARVLTLKAAWMIDQLGAKGAKSEISQIKVVVPNIALAILDQAIQMHGAAGVSEDFPLAEMFASIRTLRIADGPDEVHRALIAKLELSKYKAGKSEAA